MQSQVSFEGSVLPHSLLTTARGSSRSPEQPCRGLTRKRAPSAWLATTRKKSLIVPAMASAANLIPAWPLPAPSVTPEHP